MYYTPKNGAVAKKITGVVPASRVHWWVTFNHLQIPASGFPSKGCASDTGSCPKTF